MNIAKVSIGKTLVLVTAKENLYTVSVHRAGEPESGCQTTSRGHALQILKQIVDRVILEAA